VAHRRRPIAVVLDGPDTPAWQESALQGMRRSPLLQVLSVRALASAAAANAPAARLRRRHAALERHIFRAGPDALACVSVSAAAGAGGRSSGLAPAASRSGAGKSPSSAPAEGPDPGAGSPAGSPLTVWLAESEPPPLDRLGAGGLLHLRHAGRAEPMQDAMMHAALAGESVLESEVVLARPDATIVLERGVSAVRAFSPTVSASLALWKLAAAVARAAERLPGLDMPAAGQQARRRPPSLAAVAWHSLSSWPRALLIHLLYRRPWAIRVQDRRASDSRATDGAADGRAAAGASAAQTPELGGDWREQRSLVRWQRGHLYADPFLFEHEGAHHLFCEEVPAGAGRGVISHTRLPLDGSAAPAPAPVLELSHHISYPFVFQHDGAIFMIPETNASRSVELYRAVRFPHEWRHEATLIEDLSASDATLLREGELLWLFVGAAPPHASTLDELHLFWARELGGPWHPHPRNPVVADVRCARPAGALQRWGPRLIRPAQDCSRRYGWAVSLREIDLLSASDYSEHEIARLEPGDLGGGARATHTYATDGRFEAVDLRRRESRLGSSLARLGPRAARSGERAAAAIGARRQLEM
jgi:hypothetical protein